MARSAAQPVDPTTENATNNASGNGVATADNRRRDILETAARLFAERGYDGTSVRDIAGEVGMLAGSMYYHFASKDDLLDEINSEGARILAVAVDQALTGVADPWERLRRACIAHLEARLGGHGVFAPVVSNDLPRVPGALRARLVAHRDAYEAIFRDLVAALDLPARVDRRIYRLSLLGALNGARLWYRPGGLSPAEIAEQIFAIFDQRVSPSREDKHG